MTTRKIFVAALVWGEGGRWGNKTIQVFYSPVRRTQSRAAAKTDLWSRERHTQTELERAAAVGMDGEREDGGG